MDRTAAVRLAIRCARDSVPPLRLAIIDDLAANTDSSTQEVRRRIDKPRKTVVRQLQALHMLGVLSCREQEYSENGRRVWFYSLAEGINPDALNIEKLARFVTSYPYPPGKEVSEPGDSIPFSNISGQLPDSSVPSDISGKPDPEGIDRW
jgi:hypothetical protein